MSESPLSDIVQHPSTPDDVKTPNMMAELALSELVPLTMELMNEYGFETSSEDFVKDYKIVVEIIRAILYGQLGLRHDLHIGLGNNNPLNNYTGISHKDLEKSEE